MKKNLFFDLLKLSLVLNLTLFIGADAFAQCAGGWLTIIGKTGGNGGATADYTCGEPLGLKAEFDYSLHPGTNVTWSHGPSGQDISVTTPGTYTATATDNTGCVATASFTVNAGSPPSGSISYSPSSPVAPGTQVTVTVTGSFASAWAHIQSDIDGYVDHPEMAYTSSHSWTITMPNNDKTIQWQVHDDLGCTASGSVTIQVGQSCNLSASASGTNVSCNGGSDGSASVSISGSNGGTSYSWSNGSTSSSISGLSAGTYNVVVTEGSCTANASYTVTEPSSALNVTCSSTDASTNGGSNGTASVSASGGTTSYSYSWSNGGTSSSISGLSAGTYTVEVTDSKGCKASCSATVNEPSCNLSASASGTNVSCNGGNDGTANATVSGNSGTVSYSWSNGSTSSSISGLSAGTYSVVVTEGNCTANASYTVTEPTALNVSCSSTDVTTNGGSNGTASVNASGGTAPYSYSWSNGGTSSSISGLTAGTYTVEVTDSKGCKSTCTASVNEPGCNLSVSASGTNVSCNGGSDGTANATVSGNSGTVSYSWSNGSTSSSISGLSAGTYSVVVTEGNCTANTSHTVTEPTALNVVCSKTDVTTNGGSDGTASVSASGGTAPYSYSWSNGGTSSSISGLSAGTYTVTVTDNKGCIATCSTIVNEPGCNLSVSASGTNVSCNGGSDGTANATVSGNSGTVSYSWSNGSTSSSISGLSAGTYSVVVTEGSCTANASYTVTQPTALNVVCSKTDVTTNGGSDGTASVSVSGGTAPYSYSWSNGGTSSSISGLSAGTYTVTVTDNKGCVATCSTIVNEPGVSNCTLNVSITNIVCNNQNTSDASDDRYSFNITVDVTGGTGGGAWTSNNTSVSGGSYGVTKLINNQFKISDGILTFTVTSADGLCSKQVSVTPPATCSPVCNWDPQNTNPNYAQYTITRNDNNTPNNPNDDTISGTFTISGVPAGEQWSLSRKLDANGTSAEHIGDYPSTTTTVNWGPYPVSIAYPGQNGFVLWFMLNSVTDCLGDIFITIPAPSSCTLAVSASGTNVSCNGGSNGTASATVSGNSGTVSYLWSNGSTTSSLSNLSAGTYSVTVTEGSCSSNSSYTVTEPSVLTVVCSKTDVTTNQGNDGTATTSVTGGTSPYTYVWSNGSTSSSISGLTAGAYSVTITYAKNCTTTCAVSVNEPGCNLSATATGTNISCNGGNDGSASTTVTGNTSAVTYLWSNGATTQSITNLSTGNYTVTITESANCKTNASYIVTQPNVLTLSCTATNVTTNGGSDGAAGVTATGGTSPYSYVWSNGATTASINNLISGAYTVTVTDAKGCTMTCKSILVDPSCAKPNAGADQILACIGNSAPSTATLVSAPQGATWSLLSQPSGASATVDASGNAAGMTVPGLYQYLLSYTNNTACRDTVNVRVKNCKEFTLCGADEYQLDADPNLASYEWYQNTGNGFQIMGGQTAASITVTTVGSYYWTGKDQNGCVVSSCDTVTFKCILGSIGNYVWMDSNNDGIQDATEQPVAGVILELYLASDLQNPIAKDTTDATGKYLFTGLQAGDYIVKAIISSFPTGKVITKQNTTADANDSDFDPNTALSQVITLDPINAGGDPLLKDNDTVDLGLYLPYVCPVKICTPVKITKIR